MKASLVIFVALFLYGAAQDAKNSSLNNGDSELKIYKRLIPADVLRGKNILWSKVCA